MESARSKKRREKRERDAKARKAAAAAAEEQQTEERKKKKKTKTKRKSKRGGAAEALLGAGAEEDAAAQATVAGLQRQVDQVKNKMAENIGKGLRNYGATKELEARSQQLAESARKFARNAAHIETRAFWDKHAKKINQGIILFGSIMFIITWVFHFLNICEAPEEKPGSRRRRGLRGSDNPDGPVIFGEGEEEEPIFWAWDCPTMWCGITWALSLIALVLFQFRRKLVCCWCPRCCNLTGCCS